MAKQLRSEIDIHAMAERVWQILIDFDAYPDWNPFLVRASGRPRQGERRNLRMQPVSGRGMTFRPTVVEASPGRRLRRLGRLLVPGIFDGEHSFTIEAVGEGEVRLIQEEQFSRHPRTTPVEIPTTPHPACVRADESRVKEASGELEPSQRVSGTDRRWADSIGSWWCDDPVECAQAAGRRGRSASPGDLP